MSLRLRHLARALTVVAVLATTLTAAAALDVEGAAAADEDLRVRHGRSELSAELVSRTLDPATGRWDVVVEATLDSRALCLPAVFDCILAPEVDPAGAELVAVACPGPLWNHLFFFTDHCLKQIFTAGHDQRFRMTYRTDAPAPASVPITVRFGRGLLTQMVQELARTTLTVDLSASLDLASTCTPDLAPGGTPVTCTLTVTHPDPGDAPPAVDVAELSVASAPTSLLPAGGLVLDPGSAGSWTCTAATCTLDGGSELPAGATSTFTWTSTAASTQDGGDVAVTSTLDYGIGTADRQASAADDITVVGAGDTDL